MKSKIRKKKTETAGEFFYQAMGEIDPDLVEEVEKMERTEAEQNILQERRLKKKKNTRAKWVAVACILLMGANENSLIRNLVGGSIYREKENGRGYSARISDITEDVFQEKNGELFYIFQKANLNITDYCSETDYFLSPNIDEGGTGYVMVVGGNPNERGYALFHYEEGNFLIGEASSQIYDFGTFGKGIEQFSSPYPQLTWSHHSTHMLSETLPQEFWGSTLNSLSDSLFIEDFGTGKRIGEDGFHFEGYDLGFLTCDEGIRIAMSELNRLEWVNGLGADHILPNWEDKTNFSLRIVIYETWSAEHEQEATAVLDATGLEYKYCFIENINFINGLPHTQNGTLITDFDVDTHVVNFDENDNPLNEKGEIIENWSSWWITSENTES